MVELGIVLVAVAAAARLAAAAGLPPLTAPVAAGLLLSAGAAPDALRPPPEVVSAGGPLAAVVLLFCLGVEHTRADRALAVRRWSAAGLVDAALNLTPGFAAGLLLGWGPQVALLLGGVTWASSSGATRWVLDRLGRVGNRETPAVLGLLTLEHLGLCAYLPLAAALLTEGDAGVVAASVLATAAAVAGAAWLARERGPALRRSVFGHADAVLPVLGVAFLAAGVAAELGVPAAAGALLAGAVLAGPVTAAEPARSVLGLARHLAATAGSLFLGLSAALAPGPAAVAAALAAVTVATKLATGWWAARRFGVAARLRVGGALVARGEFAVAFGLVGVAAGVAPDLAAVTAVYVLVTSVAGPLLAAGVGSSPATTPAGRPPWR